MWAILFPSWFPRVSAVLPISQTATPLGQFVTIDCVSPTLALEGMQRGSKDVTKLF